MPPPRRLPAGGPSPDDRAESAASQAGLATAHLAGALTDAGFPPMPARVWATLLADPAGRLTAADLRALLGVSAAAISGAVRYLQYVGLLRRERDPGGRREVYIAQSDMWHDTLLGAGRTYAPIIRALDENAAVADSEQARERLSESAEFLRFVQAEMSMLAGRWEEHRAARAAGRQPPSGPRAR